jgi:hypothetical protein
MFGSIDIWTLIAWVKNYVRLAGNRRVRAAGCPSG